MTIKIEKTERGFRSGEFTDRYGKKCSIQESSLATEAAIWLGCDEGTHTTDLDGSLVCMARMHLTQEMVEDLIPLLDHFVYKGSLDEDKYEAWANVRVEFEDKNEMRLVCLGLFDDKEAARKGLLAFAAYKYEVGKCYWNGTQLLIDGVPELRGYNIGFLHKAGESKR